MTDVLRDRTVVASEIRALDPTEEPLAGLASVPCAYCRAAIPADTFVAWTAAKQLLSAICPGCQRRTTLPVTIWRRWSRTSWRTGP